MPDKQIVSPLQIERLRGSRQSWKDAEEHAHELKEKWLATKKTRDERRETLAAAADEVEGEKKLTAKQEEKLADLSRDLCRSEKKFIEQDRAKRSSEDLAKKLSAKFLEIAESIAEGSDEDLYSAEVEVGEAWRQVKLADLVGDLQAMPLAKQSVLTVAHVLEREDDIAALIKSGDLEKPQTHFVCQSVALWMQTNKRGRYLTATLRTLADKPRLKPGEVKKDETADGDGGNEGAAIEQQEPAPAAA